jgi:malonyl CoA-acyl carrier protein transacylase
MPDKDEKARRKELLHSQREEKQRSIRNDLPVPAAMMKALFDYIDKRLSSSECDDTLRHAREFIHANGLPEDTVIAWLDAAGGYCACEAISNAEELLEEAVPGYRDLPPPHGVLQ